MIENGSFKKCIETILAVDPCTHFEMVFNLMSMLILLGKYSNIRAEIMTETLAEHLIYQMEMSRKCPLLIVELLKCLKLYLDDETICEKLIEKNVAEIFVGWLGEHSDAPVKRAIADFITVASRNMKICDQFIDHGVLDWYSHIYERKLNWEIIIIHFTVYLATKRHCTIARIGCRQRKIFWLKIYR